MTTKTVCASGERKFFSQRILGAVRSSSFFDNGVEGNDQLYMPLLLYLMFLEVYAR